MGQGQASWYRAWLLLAPAFPKAAQNELTAMSIGRRNTYLFRLREMLLGPAMQAFIKCPRCQAQIEFTLDTRTLCQRDPDAPRDPEGEILIEDIFFRFRLPTTRDVARAAATESDEEARRKLLGLTILEARSGDIRIDPLDLSPTVLDALAGHISDCDPPVDLRIGLECPDCSHKWTAPFDIVAFLWSEISTLAKRLLNEVHALARVYGWREADILAMSAQRRQHYLKLVV
jgi:hypothetical protein